MIRKLAIALSLLGAFFTGFVQALGLGEVTVKSALNQPLNAEIELVNTAGLTNEEILPGLATREEFQKANVDRVYFLSDLRFEVVTGSKGKAVIVLTSKKPVREPYLNFIAELIWPSGRLLREYALLIDPPLFSDQPIAKVDIPTANSKSTGDVLSIATSGNQPQSRSLLDPINKIETSTYGSTKSTDTLWDIAIKARPNRSVSPQQVMLAIQDLNPDAFIDDNINKLKAGQVLRLPSVEQIKQRSQHQAIIGVIAQNEALSGKRSPSVIQGSKEQDRSLASSQKNAIPKNNTTAIGDELKLVVSENNSPVTTNSANSGQSIQSGSGSSNDLAITLEKLDKSSIENKELSSRVNDLEEQLSTLQRLLTLKNDQLASIQSQMRSNELEKIKSQSEAQENQDQPTIMDEVVTKEAQVSTEPQTIVETDNPSIDETHKELGEESSSNVAAEIEPTTLLNKEQDQNKLTESEIADTSVIKQNVNEPAPKNLIETIVNNPVYLAISLIIVLVLVFLLWIVSRHNAKREEEFQAQNTYDEDFTEPQFDEGSENEFDAQEDDNLDEDVDDFETSEEENDFAEEDESQDVFAEVNAYISYGRLDQAAQVLEKAISQDPVRTDYRLKLLSIYKELGDRQAFDRQFSELEAIQDSKALLAAEKIREDLLEEESLQLDTDFGLNDDQDNGDQDNDDQDDASETLNEELKAFDFDSVSFEEETENLDLSTELDLDDLDLDNKQNELSDSSDDTLEESDVLSLEEQVLDSEPEELNDVVDEDFDDSILDVELEDLDLHAELEQESEISLDHDLNTQEPILEGAAEDLVVSDDILEEATQAFEEDNAAANLDEDLSDADEFDFLNGTDEASTKLDLARAYIDMGDIDGAKDILLEVTKEGSDAQQTEAKDLLNSLD